MNCIIAFRKVHGCSLLVRKTSVGYELLEQREIITRHVMTLYGMMAHLELVHEHVADFGDKATAIATARRVTIS